MQPVHRICRRWDYSLVVMNLHWFCRTMGTWLRTLIGFQPDDNGLQQDDDGFQQDLDGTHPGGNIGMLQIPLSPVHMDLLIHPQADKGSADDIASPATGDSRIVSPNSSNIVAVENTPVPDLQRRRLHRCSQCPEVFFTSSNRRRHERSVHGGSVQCSHCLTWIRDRADYKKKHARACKAQRRDVF